MTRRFIIAFAFAAAFFFGAAAIAQNAAPASSLGTDPFPPTLGTDAPAPAPQPIAPIATAKPAPVMVEVPVLIEPKNINDVIRAEDLTLQSFPEKRIHGDALRDSTQIIGQAARRQLQAGQPLRLLDLQKEQLVKRGEDVAIIFHNGSLEITASGKAQEGGAIGDVIKVTNLGSNRIIDAKITGDKQVEVMQ